MSNKLLYTALFVMSFVLVGLIVGLIERSRIASFPSDLGLASILIALNSEVSVKQSGDSGFTSVAESVEISAGDEIRTSDSGKAVLIYPSGTLTTLNEGTHLVVKTL